MLTTITNEYLETFTVTVRKEWADPVGSSDPVPESHGPVNYVLKRNDSVLESGSLGTDGNWQVIYPNLPVFDENGEKYRYTVEETPVPEGYQVTVEQNETDTGIELVILNKYNKRNIQFKKIWDKDDQTTHPDVTIYLKRNGEWVSGQSKTIHASEAGKWFTFNAPDLEMYDGEGKVIEYSVEEDPIPNGYTCYITGSMGQGFTVRNVLTTQTVDVTVKKEWDTKTGTTLLSDLKKADVFKPVETVTIREPEWQHLFENLPLHHQSRVIQYRMEETVPAGYERPYIIHDGEDIRIENRKREPSPDYTYHFTFTKIWSGEALTSIDWNLYDQNGQIVAKDFTKKIVSDSEWEYDKWFDTNVNEYYIVENVPTGYMARYENVGSHKDVTDRCYNGGRIINHKVPPTGDRTGIWPWLLGVAAGLTGVGLLLVIRPGSGKKSRRKKEP